MDGTPSDAARRCFGQEGGLVLSKWAIIVTGAADERGGRAHALAALAAWRKQAPSRVGVHNTYRA